MADILIEDYSRANPFVAVDAATGNALDPNTSEPANPILCRSYTHLRTAIEYGGALTAVALQLWLKIGTSWKKADITTGTTALDPATDSAIRDWHVGGHSLAFFQVTGLTGTGDITVEVYGLKKGAVA